MLEPTDASRPVANAIDSFDWEDLLRYVKDRRVIPIVGPEVLVLDLDGERVLLDHYLARRLAERLGLADGELSHSPSVASVAFSYLQKSAAKRRHIYSHLKTILDEGTLPLPDTLLELAEITDFELFVATTFDSLLVRALERVRKEEIHSFTYSPEKALEDLPSKADGRRFVPAVYQLLGKASLVPDYAVTEEDRLEFLHALQSQHHPANLFDVLRENYLLLLGCRFPDWLARFFVRTIRRRRLLTARDIGELVVDDSVQRDRDLVLFLKHHAIEVYPSGAVAGFVHELHRRWRATLPGPKPGERPNAGPEPGRIPEGFIFLSYTREDGDSVAELKDSLDKSGLDAWIDTEDIPPGSDWNARINDNIRRCSIFIPCLSRRAEARKEGYFRGEWRAAIRRADTFAASRRFLWPVALDDLSMDAADIPGEFRVPQWTRFSDRDARQRLLEELKKEIRTIRSQGPGR